MTASLDPQGKNDTDRTTMFNFNNLSRFKFYFYNIYRYMLPNQENFTHFITHATSSQLYYDHSHNNDNYLYKIIIINTMNKFYYRNIIQIYIYF